MQIYATLTIRVMPKAQDPGNYLALPMVQPANGLDRELPATDMRCSSDQQQALRACQLDVKAYGLLLGQMLFAESSLLKALDESMAAAESQNALLRLSLQLDQAATDLHALRWETICHPVTRRHLACDGRILFSRFLSSAAGRNISLRTRSVTKAVVAVADPHDAKAWGLAPFDALAELQCARASLAGLDLALLGESARPATRKALLASLQPGVDILYLMAHGMLASSETGVTTQRSFYLYLTDAKGNACPVSAEDLIHDLAQLTNLPRLAILLSCESANPEIPASLARLLGEAGIPAIVAMQGAFAIATSRVFVPALLAALAQNRPIDQAVALARSQTLTAECHDWWMPALFSRIRDGRIWQEEPHALRSQLKRWLHQKQNRLHPEELEVLATALLACPSLPQLPITEIADLMSLCLELHILDAAHGSELAQLDATLRDLGLLPLLSWSELIELQQMLTDLPCSEHDLDDLYVKCRPARTWPKPQGQHVGDTLRLMLCRLATAALVKRQTQVQHPLIDFVRKLLEEFSQQVASVALTLEEWEQKVSRRLKLTPRLKAEPDNAPLVLVIQLSFVPGTADVDLTQPNAIQLFLDAWLFPAIAQPLVQSQACTLEEAATHFTALAEQARKQTSNTQPIQHIEFLLPLELIPYAFDQWPILTGMRRQRSQPVGRVYPVVTRSLDRLLLAAQSQAIVPNWCQRWQQLCTIQAAAYEQAMVLVADPSSYSLDGIDGDLRKSNTKVLLLFTALSSAEYEDQLDLLDTAIDIGLPSILFTRDRIGNPVETAQSICAVLTKQLLANLPRLAHEQRLAASDEAHHGRHLTLLWDDPDRLPPLMVYDNEQL
ncbi:MAG: CHAT domain-containing protein [Candidatus Viridilinea halotolerans]|uniref:CHAT domain-containing protein n=1 Tax=Candidatus Viridilinea halotolerans TaxID=2491704 RepID=A0A426TUN2_9CHLR|nr:MAG: CHAT domain-containing protein [Candidatus Viridilinea halotolerans]